MASGGKNGNLYALDGEAIATFVALRLGKTTKEIWHQRLGYPNKKLLKIPNNQNIINISGWDNTPSVCISCQLGKSCKLPFFIK